MNEEFPFCLPNEPVTANTDLEVKESGLGREGVRFAMEDMTEIRNLVLRTAASD